MHKIYTESIMQDKADAIREVCKLPASEKMTPPEMANKLLQYANDPGLVYSVNNYGITGNSTMQSVRLLHAAFDHHKLGNLDFDEYNKLMVTFNIADISVTHNQEYTLEDLNKGIAYSQPSADANAANNPLRPILCVNPLISIAGSANDTHVGYNKLSMVDLYKSSTEGLVYVFSQFRRLVVPGPNDDQTGGMACAAAHKITHAEDKDISIIFYKNDTNSYSVLVDGVFSFSDVRVETDQYPDYITHYVPYDDIGAVAIGDYYYTRDWGPYHSFLKYYCMGPSENWAYPIGYNQTNRFDIDYNSVTVKYTK